MDVSHWIALFVFGGLLGLAGQGIRVAAGLKKLHDAASADGKEVANLFSPSRVVISLLIGFVAGLLGAVSMASTNSFNPGAIGDETIIALVGIGYAGTDAIESLMSRYLPATAALPSAQRDDGYLG